MLEDATAVAADAAATGPDQTVQLFDVVLVKPHTHAREELQPGAKIKITAAQRTWLESLGVIAGDKPEK